MSEMASDTDLNTYQSSQGTSLMDPDTGDLYYTKSKNIVRVPRKSDTEILTWNDHLSTLKQKVDESRLRLQKAKERLLTGQGSVDDIETAKNEIAESERHITKFLVNSQISQVTNDAKFKSLNERVQQAKKLVNPESSESIQRYRMLVEQASNRFDELQKSNMMSEILQKNGLSGIRYGTPIHGNSAAPSISNSFGRDTSSMLASFKKTRKARKPRTGSVLVNKPIARKRTPKKKIVKTLTEIESDIRSAYNSILESKFKVRSKPSVDEIQRFLYEKFKLECANPNKKYCIKLAISKLEPDWDIDLDDIGKTKLRPKLSITAKRPRVASPVRSLKEIGHDIVSVGKIIDSNQYAKLPRNPTLKEVNRFLSEKYDQTCKGNKKECIRAAYIKILSDGGAGIAAGAGAGAGAGAAPIAAVAKPRVRAKAKAFDIDEFVSEAGIDMEETPDTSAIKFVSTSNGIDKLGAIKTKLLSLLRQKNIKNEHPQGTMNSAGSKVLGRVRLLNLEKQLTCNQKLSKALIVHGAVDLLLGDGATKVLSLSNRSNTTKISTALRNEIQRKMGITGLTDKPIETDGSSLDKLSIGVVLGGNMNLDVTCKMESKDPITKRYMLNEGDIYIFSKTATKIGSNGVISHTIKAEYQEEEDDE